MSWWRDHTSAAAGRLRWPPPVIGLELKEVRLERVLERAARFRGLTNMPNVAAMRRAAPNLIVEAAK